VGHYYFGIDGLSSPGLDCGQNPASCGGYIVSQATTGTFTNGQVDLSVPITNSLIQNGISYIAYIEGYTNSSLSIDPNVTLTDVYPGLDIQIGSGNSLAPVPVPASVWMLGAGLLTLLGAVNLQTRTMRDRNPGPAGASPSPLRAG
jgi:hypothetical protein